MSEKDVKQKNAMFEQGAGLVNLQFLQEGEKEAIEKAEAVAKQVDEAMKAKDSLQK